MAKKSILEETLSEIGEIKQILGENAKDILRTTLKGELNTILSEAITEDEDEEIAIDDTESNTEVEIPTDDSTDDVGDELDVPSPDEIETQDISTEEIPVDLEPEMDLDEPEDLRGMSQEEVLDVFKKMGPEDQVVVVKDGDDIQLADGENEYIIKTDETTPNPEMDMDIDLEPEMDLEPVADVDLDVDMETEPIEESENVLETEESDETIFEIEINEEDLTEEKPVEELEESVIQAVSDSEFITAVITAVSFVGAAAVTSFWDNITEFVQNKIDKSTLLQRAKSIGANVGDSDESMKPSEENQGINEQLIKTRQKLANSVAKNKNLTEQLSEVNVTISEFTENEGQYKEAVSVLREQLEDVAIFTTNLIYTVKLMTEHSTTKGEKREILNRFDAVNTLSESKTTYETLIAEMSNSKKPVMESVHKIVEGSNPSSGSKLNETTVFIKEDSLDPQSARIKELMDKIK